MREESREYNLDETPDLPSEGKETDLVEIFFRLWNRKWIILMWCVWGAIAGLVIAFSIPKEYTTRVKLAPEASGSKGNMGGLGALASMAGFSTSAASGTDAVNPQLYPDVVTSVPFVTDLFDVEITPTDGKRPMRLREYILRYTKEPWWKAVMALPSKMFGKEPERENQGMSHQIDNFRLTPEESALVYMISSRVKAEVDQKTNMVIIDVMMQDPLVSAIIADTVVKRLQNYVTDYRTNKSRRDLEYAEKLNAEAQQEYYKAQQRLADYSDRNQNLATRSAQVVKDRLDNEASLAFNLYNQTSQQVQAAKAKVQETTPVYAVVTPATVPMKPTSPRKGLIIGGFTFLGFMISVAWIIFWKPLRQEYKTRSEELKLRNRQTDKFEDEDNDEELF